jgi:hypothetical protein
MEEDEVFDALSKQVGGGHYKDKAIQPITRWREKNGIADLEKAKHYIELLIELNAKAT